MNRNKFGFNEGNLANWDFLEDLGYLADDVDVVLDVDVCDYVWYFRVISRYETTKECFVKMTEAQKQRYQIYQTIVSRRLKLTPVCCDTHYIYTYIVTQRCLCKDK